MEEYKNLVISSYFGLRKNPITMEDEFHRGIDFLPLEPDRYVYAGFSSVYFRDNYGNREGNFIQLITQLLDTKFYINIFHLETVLPQIKSSRLLLRPDDKIAIAGTSGSSTGIHIHYEIFSYFINDTNQLTHKVNYTITDERRKRIFFDPIELWDFCRKNNIYI